MAAPKPDEVYDTLPLMWRQKYPEHLTLQVDDKWLLPIMQGIKKVEGRKGGLMHWRYSQWTPGTQVLFYSKNLLVVEVIVEEIREYDDLTMYLNAELWYKVLPSPDIQSWEDAYATYLPWVPAGSKMAAIQVCTV